MSDETNPRYEVVQGEAGGWGVRLVGDSEEQSNHATREEAEAAARKLSGEGADVQVREDERAPTAPQDKGGKPALSFGIAWYAIVLAIVIVLAVVLAT